MTLSVAVLDDYQGAAPLGPWDKLGDRARVRFFQDHLADEDALAERLRPFECVVLMRERTPVTARLLERLPALRLLVTTGPFNAVVDVAAAHQHGVVVCGTGGIRIPNTDATAELTWALILSLVRHVPLEDRGVRSGIWQQTVGTDLYGATLGLMGLGHIGQAVAHVGRAFGMKILAWSQNLTAERAAASGAALVDKDELLSRADVLSIHLVLSDRTRGLVGEQELALMQPDAFLVNTSRAPIVVESALVAALAERRIAGAGLDVFDPEPLPSDHPFCALDNVVLTPHLGYVTRRTYSSFFTQIVEDIEAYLDGTPIRVLENRNTQLKPD